MEPSPARPSISLCMIVKNEAAHLARCLASVRDWVDEMVVVDTGSTDRTVEVAQGFGAKLTPHAWQDDFAEARNFSLGLATGDWVLVLDADEELDQATGAELRRVVADSAYNGYVLQVLNLMADGTQGLLQAPRLFRNHRGVRYQGAIHETPRGLDPVGVAGVRVLHHGYNLSPEQKAAKHAQRVELLRRWVVREPASVPAHTYLAQRLNAHGGDPDQALRHGLEALRLAEEQGPGKHEMGRIYRAVCFALAAQRRFGEVVGYARRFQADLPDHPDGYFLELGAQVEQHHWAEIVEASDRLLHWLAHWEVRPGQCPYREVISQQQAPLALHSRVLALAHLGREEEAGQEFARLLDRPGGQARARALIGTLRDRGFTALAMKLASEAGTRYPQYDWSHPNKDLTPK